MANTLSVGSDQAYHTIADAVAASHAGDTIAVQAGTYTNDWAQIGHDLTIVGVGGMAHIDSTAPIDNGKAELVTNGNVTVENMEFSGATVGDHNGAGIRHESGSLTVINCSFHDNQEGILAGDNPNSSITVQNSSFVHNGAGDGQSHGLYAGQIASLSVDGSTFFDQVDGNQLKSRAAETTVSNSHFSTGPDGANYDIDLPNGGNANIHDNTFYKGATTNNPAIIHFGGEIDNPSGSLTVEHNSFYAEIPNATAVLDQTNLPVLVSNNALSGVAHLELGGPATLVNNDMNAVLDPSTWGGSDPATTAVASPPPSDPTPVTTSPDPSTVATSTDPTASDPTTADPTTTDTASSGDTIDTSAVTADSSDGTSDPTAVDWVAPDPTVTADSYDYGTPLPDANNVTYGGAEGVVALGPDGQWQCGYWYS